MASLRQFNYLVSIADLRHFGRAAQACGVAQPTLSQQLRALEDRLGVVLVERGSVGAELTPIGREIAERARRLLSDVQDIHDLARSSRDGGAGTIRLGTTPTLGPYLMPGVVARLHSDQPDLKLYIREGFPDHQALELSRGRLDMLLAPLPILGDNLLVEPLVREPLHLIAARSDPLSCTTHITPEDLRGRQVLSFDPRHPLHRKIVELCAEYGMVPMRDYEGTSLDSVRQMVGSGIGLAVIPDFYIRSEVGGDAGVQVLRIEGWNVTRSIAAAWRSAAAFGDVYRAIAARIREEAMRISAKSHW